MVAHGVFDDGPYRAPLVADLAGKYDVVAVDARGHGRSDVPETGYDAETRADDLAGLVGALDLEDPILFRHSMGGDTVAAAAARYPDLPRVGVLEDPAAMLDHGEDDWKEPIAWARDRLELWENHTKAELLSRDRCPDAGPQDGCRPAGMRARPAAGRWPAEGRLLHVPDVGPCVFRDSRERATGELRSFLDNV